MKATIVFEDNLMTGEVDVSGSVDGLAPEALPSGAQIMFAYMNTHMAKICSDAQEWFRTELVSRVAASKDEVTIHGA